MTTLGKLETAGQVLNGGGEEEAALVEKSSSSGMLIIPDTEFEWAANS